MSTVKIHCLLEAVFIFLYRFIF